MALGVALAADIAGPRQVQWRPAASAEGSSSVAVPAGSAPSPAPLPCVAAPACAASASLPSASALASPAPRSPSHGAARCARWLGLVPRQHTTGGKPRLGKISKMGQRDLRRLLITGAMSVVRNAARRGETTDPWLARWPSIVRAISVSCRRSNSPALGRLSANSEKARENVASLGSRITGGVRHRSSRTAAIACRRPRDARSAPARVVGTSNTAFAMKARASAARSSSGRPTWPRK